MLNKDTIVTMPILRKWEFEECKNIEPKDSQLTLYDALDLIVEKNEYALYDLVFHNIPVRDRLREIGMRALLDELLTIHPSDKLKKIFDRFEWRGSNNQLAEFDIQLYSVADKVAILGGVVDLKSLIKGQKHGNSDGMPIYAAKAAYRYPCFDAEDYANEDRFYQYYILRDNPISAEEFADFKKRTEQLDEKTPPDLLPMAYYVGEGAYMLVATRKAQCDTDNAE